MPEFESGKHLKLKIMKTTFRTLAIIGTFAIIGFSNINAVADNKVEMNTEKNAEAVVSESDAILDVLENNTSVESDTFINWYANQMISLIQTNVENEFIKTAELETASTASAETEKYADMLIEAMKAKAEK